MGLRRRQLTTAAPTANAVRPVPGFRLGIGACFAGWLTGALSPQVLTTMDALAHVARGRRGPVGLALEGARASGVIPSISSVHILRAMDHRPRHRNCWRNGIPTAAAAESVAGGHA